MVDHRLHVYDKQMFASKTPVTKLADFAGKRTRVLASEGEQAMVARARRAPVPMSLPEVLPALQQGTIDGVTSVLGVFVAFRYYDAAPNLLDTGLWALVSTRAGQQALVRQAAGRSAEGRDGRRRQARGAEPRLADQAHRDDRKATWTDSSGKFVKLSPRRTGRGARSA